MRSVGSLTLVVERPWAVEVEAPTIEFFRATIFSHGLLIAQWIAPYDSPVWDQVVANWSILSSLAAAAVPPPG
ncbi:hypothetical protein TPY_0417 [Sulfobacillus acidophilus TPY]|nr:hypothetical protein TPY_0417 [Sulfobacillus acidophilus TPY]